MSDPFNSCIGHARAVYRLRLMIESGDVPHAVVFSGPRNVGKRTLAFAAAAALLGTDAPERHPDFRLVERPRDEKTDKLKQRIPIEAVRGLQEHFRMSAFLGGAKVAVVDGAEALSEEASNAFLKTLEEPAPRSYVFLCAESASKLPKTILSRATEFALRRVPDAEIAAGLVSRGADAGTAERHAARSDGRPGLALAFLEGSDVVDWYQTEERRFRSLRDAPLHRRFAALSELAPPRADREETVQKLRDVIALWRSLLRRDLREGAGAAAADLRALDELLLALEANVQPRLLLERFALTFAR